MASDQDQNEDETWDLRLRQDEEEDFFTELALHETERWVTAVTRKKFQYPDDFRKSLENGVLLCELLNVIKPGCIRRINKLPGAIAGLDNISVFLKACRSNFHLTEAHLFDANDLEDLSQRAISDSEHILKQESDRRARNVAIGIYWLGKSIANTFSGPQLDFSAFAALVHHHGNDLISTNHYHHDSWESPEHSSAYGSHESNSRGSLGDSVDTKHVRDSSYDSYGSLSNSRESELSFTQEDDNMPGIQMRRYDSTPSVNRSSDFSLEQNSEEDSLYQSTPDLTNSNHTRTSSTDSMDGCSGNHSRQSSDSTNVAIPTRSLDRKTSTSNADPLQFVKVISSKDMAKVASLQIKMVQEVKKVRNKIDKEEEDWQSNFSDWRNKRRRKSGAQLQRVEETDKIVREEEAKKQAKTYGQMMEDRERRKSTGTFMKKPMSFYPVDDDDDLFAKVKTPSHAAPVEEIIEKKVSPKVKEEAPSWRRSRAPMLSPKQRSSSVGSDKVYIHYDDTKTADWADSSPSDEDDNSVPSDRLTETSPTATEPHTRSTKMLQRSKTTDPSWGMDATDKKWSGGASAPSRSPGKILSLLKSFEQKEVEAKVDYTKPKRISETLDSSRYSGISRKSATFDSPSSSFSFSAPDKAESTPVRSTITDKTVPVPTKASVEKTIKISQKPDNAKGFGFTIVGGADKRQPITVLKISLGSAADVCEVQQKDEILAINKRDITMLSHAQVQHLIDEANRHGQIELKVRRIISEGDEDSEDDDSAFMAQSPTSPTSPSPKMVSALSPRMRGSPGLPTPRQDSIGKSPSGYMSQSPEDRYGSGSRTENRPVASKSAWTYSPGAITPEPRLRSGSPRENRYSTPLTESRNRSVSPAENRYSASPLLDSRNRSHSPAGIPYSASPLVENRRRSGSPADNKYSSLLTGNRRSESPEESRITSGSPALNRRYPSPTTTGMAETTEQRTESPLQRSYPLYKSPSDRSTPDTKIFPQYTHKIDDEEETNNNEVKANNKRNEIIKDPSPTMDSKIEVSENITPVRKNKDFSTPVQEVMSVRTAPEVETSPKEEVTISTRETITVKRRESPEIKSYKWEPPAAPARVSPPPADDGDNGGPPASLRRWQQGKKQARPQSAYASFPDFKAPKEEKRLNGPYPWETSSVESDKKEKDIEPQIMKLDHRDNYSSPLTTQVGQPVMLEIPDHEDTSPATKATSVKVTPSYNPGLLQIDPRNQMNDSDINIPEYSFHVNLNKPNQSEPRTLTTKDDIELEHERELIRQEEQQRLEAEKKFWEEEEMMRIREKEEELRKQEEEIRQAKEKLREEQENIQKEKEELKRSRQQNELKENKPENQSFQSRQSDQPKSQFSTSAINENSKQSALRKLDLTWPPQKEEPPPRQILTRQDMMAMNRRATPLQRKPDVEVNSEPSKSKDVSSSREAPTKNDLHNLNAVPKQKFRPSKDWMKEDGEPQKSRSDNARSSPNLNEHWLVEEAERRRKATTQNSHGAGIIRPVSDGIGNRWRDDSLVPKQQASINVQGANLTQPRPLSSNISRGLDSSRQYNPASQTTKSMSQTLPRNFNYSSLTPKNLDVPAKPTRNSSSSTSSSLASPSSPLNPSEQFMAVSGKQACSYCSHELGFGAAMVIESLGLYYHVQCFRCCVCHTTLGNGSQGADVRVRVNKLHCRNCYSNDEAGLKFSKV